MRRRRRPGLQRKRAPKLPTSYSRSRKTSSPPTLRSEAKSRSDSVGKPRSSRTRSTVPPTSPVAPKIPTLAIGLRIGGVRGKVKLSGAGRESGIETPGTSSTPTNEQDFKLQISNCKVQFPSLPCSLSLLLPLLLRFFVSLCLCVFVLNPDSLGSQNANLSCSVYVLTARLSVWSACHSGAMLAVPSSTNEPTGS